MHVRAVHRKGAARHPPAHHGQEEYRRELKSNEVSQVFPCGAGTLACQTANTASQLFSVSAAILSHAVKRPNPRRPSDHYLRTQSTPSRWLLTFHERRCPTVLSANHGPFLRLCANLRICPASRHLARFGCRLIPPGWAVSRQSDKFQRRKRSPSACFMTCPPTSEMDLVSGISLGQTSTQFCA